MASLVKQGDVWYVKYYDATGKQKWVKGYTQKGETEKLGHRLEDEKTRILRGDLDPQQEAQKVERRKAIADHIEEYRNHLTAGGRSDNHLSYTIADIEAFVEFAQVATASTITRTQVDAWVLELVAANEAYRSWQEAGSEGKANGSANSARTINRRVGSVQAFLKWAQQAGAVTQYVLNKYPKREVRGNAIRQSRALTDDEVTKLLAWAKKNTPARHDLYQLALLSGLRAEECAALTPASFDLERGTLTVHSKDPRHSDRVDVVPLHPELTKLVAKLAKGKATGTPLFELPRQQAEQLREDCIAAGIDAQGVTFHGLRHTFVTRLARKNVHPTITRKLARHRDIAMTLGYYTHWSTADEKAALAML
jgi:integrase